jgi:NAD(P)-dependent dehydrogenase (short-subunit alcohol dehydrogenase family)
MRVLEIAEELFTMRDANRSAIYPSLAGRVVVVTGGASGIGEAIVEAFVAQRAQVVFLDIQDEAAERLIERMRALGGETPLYRRCDLTDIGHVRQTMDEILAIYPEVNVLVNNAGNDTRHTVEEVTPESWDQLMAVNLKHQFFMAQALIPAMRMAGGGSIVNMSSISWVIPSTGVPIYVMAKAAIVGMTRTLAHTVGKDNIRVNSVMPGAILTERQKRLWLTEEYTAEVLSRQALKRMILPEEVARLVLFLASDDSSAITNQSYVIDGGWV